MALFKEKTTMQKMPLPSKSQIMHLVMIPAVDLGAYASLSRV